MKKPEFSDFGITQKQYDLCVKSCKDDEKTYKEEKKIVRFFIPFFVLLVRIFILCKDKWPFSDEILSFDIISKEVLYFSLYFLFIPFLFEYIYWPLVAYNVADMPEAKNVMNYEKARMEYEQSMGNDAHLLIYPLKRKKIKNFIHENIFRIIFVLFVVLFQYGYHQKVPDYVCRNLAKDIVRGYSASEKRRAFKEFNCPKKMIEDEYSKKYMYRK